MEGSTKENECRGGTFDKKNKKCWEPPLQKLMNATQPSLYYMYINCMAPFQFVWVCTRPLM